MLLPNLASGFPINVIAKSGPRQGAPLLFDRDAISPQKRAPGAHFFHIS